MESETATILAACSSADSRVSVAIFGMVPALVLASVLVGVIWVWARPDERRDLVVVLLVAAAIGGIAHLTAQGEGGKQFKVSVVAVPILAFAVALSTRRFGAWKAAVVALAGDVAVPALLIGFAIFGLAFTGECLGT